MYNSLLYTQKLEACGFTREQAETTVSLVMETMDQHFATKADLRELDTSMKQQFTQMRFDVSDQINGLRFQLKEEIASVRTELKEEIASVRSELKEDIASVRTDMKVMESRMTLKLGTIMLAGIALLQYLK